MRKQRLTRIPLPSVIMGNVQSLRNKVGGFQGNVCFQKDFRDFCVLAFTETWLTESDQDSDLFSNGFGAPFRHRKTRSGSEWNCCFIIFICCLFFCGWIGGVNISCENKNVYRQITKPVIFFQVLLLSCLSLSLSISVRIKAG